MNEHNSVPNIRFRNFKDEWAEKKISNFIIKNSDKNKNLAIKNIESISNKTGFTKQSEQFDGYRVASQDISNYYVISPNQFAYNPSRINVGSIAYKNTGEDKSIISPLYISFSTSSHINDHFLWFWFKTTSFKKQRIQFSEGGVRDTLPFENLKKMEISFPLLQEQQKIGDFFSRLDKLLDLQQQKIDKLELLKKALLQKLFPKYGAKIPELRFKGCDGEWEEKKFSSLYKKSNEKNNLSFGSNKIISVANMYYKKDNVKSDDNYMRTYNIFRLGDIAFEGHKSKKFTFGRFVENTIGDGIVSHVFEVFKPISNGDITYWKYAIHNEDFIARILMKSTVKATMMNNLIAKDFLKQRVPVPQLSEQQKIGNLLSKVDQLIELENKKLQNLQQVKKCLLQNMFVE